MEANLVYDIAEEYGVHYINFLDMDGLVDFDTDCFDSVSHLNASGARKVTEYIGAFIRENYDVMDRREDVSYASWQGDYESYTANKLELLKSQQSLDCELVLLYDNSFSTKILIKEDSEILLDERMMKLINNAASSVEIKALAEYDFPKTDEGNVGESDIPDVQIETTNSLTGELINQSICMAGGLDEYGNITAFKVD